MAEMTSTPTGRQDRPESPTGYVPLPLQVAAAWSWRVLLVAVAVTALILALQALSLVVVPLAVACLLTVLLTPLAGRLTRHTPIRRGLAALISVLLLIVFVVGVLSLVGTQIASGMTDMRSSVEQGVQQVLSWLETGPLHLSSAQLSEYAARVQEAVRSNSSRFTSGALTVGASALDFLAGSVIALITTFFLIAQGDQIWRFLIRLLPRRAQQPTNEAFRRGWVSLGAYARTQVLVAGVDAVGIGLGALVLGLPFVVPLTLLVFISSFVPIVGAIFSGAVAVLVALVVKGPTIALIMLAVVLLVQQLESHVLQPFLMGHAVALHPLAVIFAVAIGAHQLGVVGALFAVPFLAVANTVVRYYVGQDPFPDLGVRPLPSAETDEQTDAMRQPELPKP